jgi:outer membrane biosynthesis protein TonB
VSSAKADSTLRHLTSNSIGRAFAISVVLHFLFIGTLEVGRRMGWWNHSFLPKMLQSRVYQEVLKAAEERKKQQALQKEPPETQMVFVEVDPSQATPEPPKETKYYSSQNSLASNPDTKVESLNPKITGNQDKVPKTFDTMKPEKATQPAPKPESKSSLVKVQPKTPPEKQIQPQPEAPKVKEQPEPKPDPGDILVARAAPKPPPQAPVEQSKPKPRTLAEAMAQKGIIQGQKMKQEGGVKRNSLQTSLDAKSTPFGSYDAAFIAAVQARWFSLLEQKDYVGNSSGKVVLEFRLNKDGRILDMRVAESSVPEFLQWLCQRAVLDPAPYMPFPMDLRRLYNGDARDVRFTFYYNQ